MSAAIVGYLITTDFLIIYCGLLLFVMTASLFSFGLKLRSLGIQLRRAVSRIREVAGEVGFCASFSEIDVFIRTQCPDLAHSWAEFSENLIKPTPNQYEEERVIRNSKDAFEYFNEATLVVPKVNLPLFNGVPNWLLAGGIFGTFVGLAAGIGLASGHLDSDNIDEVRRGLKPLLSGASLAFMTSIAGLASSILCSVLQKRMQGKLHGEIETWNQEVDRRVRLVTVEQLAGQQLEELRTQSHQLKRFNTDLAAQLADALDARLESHLEQHVGRLVQALEGIQASQSSASEELLREIVGQFKSSLSDSTHQHFDQLGVVLERLNEALSSSSAGLTQAQGQMQQASVQVAETIERAMGAGALTLRRGIAGTTDVVAKQLEAAGGALGQHLEAASQHAAQRLAAATAGFEGAVERLADSVATAEAVARRGSSTLSGMETLCSTIESAHGRFEAIVEPIGAASHALSEAVAESGSATEQLSRVGAELKAGADLMRSSAVQTQKTWEAYQARFGEVDVALAKIVGEIDRALERYTARVTEFVQTMENHTGDAVRTLGGAVAELHETVDDLSEAVRAVPK